MRSKEIIQGHLAFTYILYTHLIIITETVEMYIITAYVPNKIVAHLC